ncbi:hypothetical protein [Sphaerochaeta sp. PS]|uniref:hypothetical protein n=1 Tax=Sphaerochaeta sp. PS TaxID=3076336 RepID=UPI0028A563D8|nr:hypothetical protein [Sphaerochaeta sp. PS]MDT4761834.1 hypothetical protein [Sphaerochaeta sp. PS]
MSEELELRGERVNSRSTTPMRKQIAKVAKGINKRIAENIPFWPEVISYPELAAKVGLSVTATTARIAGVQEQYMVFQHRKGISRIRPDYSNIEIRRND